MGFISGKIKNKMRTEFVETILEGLFDRLS